MSSHSTSDRCHLIHITTSIALCHPKKTWVHNLFCFPPFRRSEIRSLHGKWNGVTYTAKFNEANDRSYIFALAGRLRGRWDEQEGDWGDANGGRAVYWGWWDIWIDLRNQSVRCIGFAFDNKLTGDVDVLWAENLSSCGIMTESDTDLVVEYEDRQGPCSHIEGEDRSMSDSNTVNQDQDSFSILDGDSLLDAEGPQMDLPPLFVHVTCSVNVKSCHGSMPVRTLPTCLGKSCPAVITGTPKTFISHLFCLYFNTGLEGFGLHIHYSPLPPSQLLCLVFTVSVYLVEGDRECPERHLSINCIITVAVISSNSCSIILDPAYKQMKTAVLIVEVVLAGEVISCLENDAALQRLNLNELSVTMDLFVLTLPVEIEVMADFHHNRLKWSPYASLKDFYFFFYLSWCWIKVWDQEEKVCHQRKPWKF